MNVEMRWERDKSKKVVFFTILQGWHCCQSSAVTGYPWRCCCVEGTRWLADFHDSSTTCNVQCCISATLESLVTEIDKSYSLPSLWIFSSYCWCHMQFMNAFKSPSYHTARKQELCSLGNINSMASSATVSAKTVEFHLPAFGFVSSGVNGPIEGFHKG